MKLLRDMLLLPVAGSLALLGGIAALIFGGAGVLLSTEMSKHLRQFGQ